MKQVFLSHASADHALVDAVFDLLVKAGVPREQIFYSSGSDSGIPIGVEPVGHMRQRLQNAGLIIEFLSPTFIDRPFCMVELGGAWALEHSVFPIILPPLRRSDVIMALGHIQARELTQAEAGPLLDELHDRLESCLDVQLPTATWNRERAAFLDRLDVLLAVLPGEQVRDWKEAFDRRYEMVESAWEFARSSARPDLWDAVNKGRRRVIAGTQGLTHLNIAYTREAEFLRFDDAPPPPPQLLTAERSDPGRIDLRPPHSRTGRSFAFQITFTPALAEDEVADIRFRVQMPQYKFGYGRELLNATAQFGRTTRRHDFSSRDVDYPTDMLMMSAFLPRDLSAVPDGFECVRGGRTQSDEVRLLLARKFYTVDEGVENDGSEGELITIRRPFPLLNARYRIRWLPPWSAEDDSTGMSSEEVAEAEGE